MKFEDDPLIKRYLKTHDEIAVAMENEKNKPKTESDPFDLTKENIMQAKVFISNYTLLT